MRRSKLFALLPLLLLPACLLACASSRQPATVPAQAKVCRLAVYDDAGASRSVDQLCKVLALRPDFQITRVKAKDIQNGMLKNRGFAAVLFPGGSGSKQGGALGKGGREQVREFVRSGGGYVGFCAGAYLATCHYTWSLGVLNAHVVDRQHWARGFGDVSIALTGEGKTILDRTEERPAISYRQGPLLAPAGNKALPPYRVLASFKTEVAKKGAPQGVMIGTTAIAAGEFGKGRVLCFSPHPEWTPGMEPALHHAVKWACGEKQ